MAASGAIMSTIHFWLPEEPNAAVDSWNPDLEPQRFEDGVGRALIEPYRRFAAEGLAVSIGPEVVKGASLLVIAGKSVVRSRSNLRAALRAIGRTRGHFVLLRSDIPTSWRFPLRPLIEFVPSPSSVRRPWQRWVPELPQRGLRPRLPERRGRIRSVVFKGNPENVPRELLEGRWQKALEARGLEWWLDVPHEGGGQDQAWHDYREVDISLCLRHPSIWRDIGRKPAGKLIDAWVAGCIPIAGREPAYLDIGNPGRDVLFVDTVWESLDVIDTLDSDAQLLREIERHLAERAAEFAPAVVLAAWRDALLDAAASAPPKGVARVIARAKPLSARPLLRVEYAARASRAFSRRLVRLLLSPRRSFSRARKRFATGRRVRSTTKHL
jgi:hypothetical protein